MAADAINDTPNSGTASRSKCGFAVIDMPWTIPLPRNPKQRNFAAQHLGPPCAGPLWKPKSHGFSRRDQSMPVESQLGAVKFKSPGMPVLRHRAALSSLAQNHVGADSSRLHDAGIAAETGIGRRQIKP